VLLLKSAFARNRFVSEAIKYLRSRRRTSFGKVASRFEGARGLEIGGPSPIFSRHGPFPIYAMVGSLDNVNFSGSTYWSSVADQGLFEFDGQKPAGIQLISDAVRLSAIEDGAVDLLICSHVIEHIANPLKALVEWRRVLRIGGTLVVVAPDKRYTYDRRRPTTALTHLVDDFERRVEEDDSTHFAEILALHDLSNDGSTASPVEHRDRTLRNAENRMAHHHVFDLPLLKSVLVRSGFVPIVEDAFRPYHLLVVASKYEQP